MVLGCLLITACARKSPEPEQKPTQAVAPPAPSVATLPKATELVPKDCEGAQRYRDNICELAKKICGTPDDSVGNAAEGTYCSDARTQCDQATQRYRSACE
jgi:hypothetical protein